MVVQQKKRIEITTDFLQCNFIYNSDKHKMHKYGTIIKLNF